MPLFLTPEPNINFACVFANLNYFQTPSDVLVKAAKVDQKDALQGSLEALSWGQTPSVGTGHRFDIIYSGKVRYSSSCVLA